MGRISWAALQQKFSTCKRNEWNWQEQEIDYDKDTLDSIRVERVFFIDV